MRIFCAAASFGDDHSCFVSHGPLYASGTTEPDAEGATVQREPGMGSGRYVAGATWVFDDEEGEDGAGAAFAAKGKPAPTEADDQEDSGLDFEFSNLSSESEFGHSNLVHQ